MVTARASALALTYEPRRDPDPDRLIAEHLPLVRRIAWHVHGRVSKAIEIEDLVQTGVIALIEAARAYQDRGHAFATYAKLRIRGAMIDGLRKHAAACRSASHKRRTLEATTAHLQHILGRMPTNSEVATELGLDDTGFRDMQQSAQSLRIESIDDLYSDHSMWFADATESADEGMERAELHSLAADAIRSLPTREATILQMYFVEEMNLEEIGLTLGLTPARICQIKKKALETVRARLTGAVDDDA